MTGQHLLERGVRTALNTPLRVAVQGLPGVGVRTVLTALTTASRCTAVEGIGDQGLPDVTVRVIAEVLKPEDRSAIAAAAGPVLVVLNKADTCGLGPGGPVETARRRCTELAVIAGVPVIPVVGLLGVAAVDTGVLDEELVGALRVLLDCPADLRTAETFVAGTHPVPAAVRQRLVDVLDVFGVALAVLVLRRPTATAADVRTALRRVSGIDPLVSAVVSAGRRARYRRLHDELAELEATAIGETAVAELLDSDEVVLARMAAAVEVMEADGVAVGQVQDAAAWLARAVYWQRFGAGPLTALHAACAADITRGSLRMWGARR